MESTTTVSPFIGLIIFSNSLLLSNYLFIRSKRRLTDAQTEQKLKQHNTNGHNNNSIEERGVLEHHWNSFERCLHKASGLMLAFIFGYIGKETNSHRKFPKWDHIPYAVGKIATITSLSIFALLFSKRSLFEWFQITAAGVNVKQVLCTTSDAERKLENFTSILSSKTNFNAAKQQYDHTVQFYDALIKDTSLYGTSGYECSLEPQTKEAFLQSDQYGKTAGTRYFPGYCQAAQASALAHARNTTCVKQVCGEAETITDVDVEFTQNRWEMGKAIFNNEIPDTELNYEYGYKEFCEEVRVACPDFSLSDELDDVLEDYKLEQYKVAQDGVQKVEEIEASRPAVSAQLQEAGEEIVNTLQTQIDHASTGYVVYSCLGLLFPSPLFIFRPQYGIAIKRFFFGARKHVFIMVVLTIWWGITYFKQFHIDTYYTLYLKSLLRSPCLGDPSFVLKVSQTFTEHCDDLVQMSSEHKIQSTAITQTLELVDMFRDCQCDYPFAHLTELMPRNETHSEHLSGLFFGRTHDDLCSSASSQSSCNNVHSIQVQDTDVEFLGNTTICDDPSYARQHLVDRHDDDLDVVNWWNIWIGSGILAALLVKTCATNVTLSLLQFADPFSSCDGEYEGPPGTYSFGTDEELEELRNTKESNLRSFALGRICFWGLLTNLCMFNLWQTMSLQIQQQTQSQQLLSILLLALSVVPLLLSIFSNVSVNRQINLMQNGKVVEDDLHMEEDVQFDLEGSSINHNKNKRPPPTAPTVTEANQEPTIITATAVTVVPSSRNLNNGNDEEESVEITSSPGRPLT